MAIKIDIYDGERQLATVPVVLVSLDLADAGIGTGRHAYFYTPPADLKDGRQHMIRARLAGSQTDLAGSPQPFSLPGASDLLAVVASMRHRVGVRVVTLRACGYP